MSFFPIKTEERRQARVRCRERESDTRKDFCRNSTRLTQPSPAASSGQSCLGLSAHKAGRWLVQGHSAKTRSLVPACSVASVEFDPLRPHRLQPHQAPLSMGFSRLDYWSGLPCPPPGDLPDPGIEPVSPAAPALQVDSLSLSHSPGSKTSAPLLGGPGVGLGSSSSLLSQALGSESSGCPFLRVPRWPSGPSHVVSRGDQIGPQPGSSPAASGGPGLGDPAPRPVGLSAGASLLAGGGGSHWYARRYFSPSEAQPFCSAL